MRWIKDLCQQSCLRKPVVIGGGLVVVAGEITTSGFVDIPSVVRETINEIGYDRDSLDFNGSTCGVMAPMSSHQISLRAWKLTEEVRSGKAGEEDALDRQGAGDQGMMFGYACRETDALMPLPIHVAHRMAEQLTEARKSGQVPYLRPDGKTQVSFEYEDGRPVKLKTVLVSTQHNPGIERIISDRT